MISEEKMHKSYPNWYRLSDEEKEIVNNIAMQIPISCEDVAIIFILFCDSDRKRTVDYIYQQYGFIIE